MKIAFLSPYDPTDVHRWSGTTAHIFAALSSLHDVTWVGKGVLESAMGYHRFVGNTYPFFPETYQEQFGRLLTSQVANDQFDIIITTTYYFLPYLRTTAPIILVSDTTFDLFRDYAGFSEKYSQLARKTERKAFEVVDLVLFASEWARTYAIEKGYLPAEKTAVVEFGANISSSGWEQPKTFEVCRLLFVGRNWTKKGGDIALQAYYELRNRGVPCKLTIVGCTPSFDIDEDDVEVYAYLDKANEVDYRRLQALYAQSHFLLFPTTFDAFGIVVCEASAFGVPTIATDVGGVSQPLVHQKNGILLSPAASAIDFATSIEGIWSDREKYQSLSAASLYEYESRLNWEAWTRRFNELVEELVEAYASYQVSSDWIIPLYAINLLDRPERKLCLKTQFTAKEEYNLQWVQAYRAQNPAKGLWDNIVWAIKDAVKNRYEIVIICEDDHIFTPAYHYQFLLACLMQAEVNKLSLVLGGVTTFGAATPISENLMAVDWFFGTQFSIIFSHCFQQILSYEFKEGDAADLILSNIIPRKAVITPFISNQYDWGYSDISQEGRYRKDFMRNTFLRAELRLSQERRLYQYFYRGI